MDLEPASIAQVKMTSKGRVVEVDSDVFDVAKRLKEVDPSLGLRWSEAGEYFVVYQEMPDGSRHLVTTSQTLTPAIVDRVREVASPDYDLAAEIEKREREADAEMDQRVHEHLGEVGERLAHAIRKDLDERKPDYVRYSDRRRK